MCLRVAGFDFLNTADTDGLAVSVFFQGCGHGCKGCHNRELWDSKGGTEWLADVLVEFLAKKTKKGTFNYDYVVLSGGDPLFQRHYHLRRLVEGLVSKGIKVWMYTGYEYGEVPQWCKDLCYCIKTGKYDPENYPPLEGSKLASSNQKYYFQDGRVSD